MCLQIRPRSADRVRQALNSHSAIMNCHAAERSMEWAEQPRQSERAIAAAVATTPLTLPIT
jgi:hypothetical protein